MYQVILYIVSLFTVGLHISFFWFSRVSRNRWWICWWNMCNVRRGEWRSYFESIKVSALEFINVSYYQYKPEEQEILKSMGLSTRKGLLFVLSQLILTMTDYLFSMLKYNGFTSTEITKSCSHISLKYQIEIHTYVQLKWILHHSYIYVSLKSFIATGFYICCIVVFTVT